MSAYFLQSARLGFRLWTDADLPLATSLWTDPDVMRYLGTTMTLEQVSARLALEINRQRTLGIQYWPMFSLEHGDLVGCSGLRPFHDENGVREIGVHLARRFWGGRYGEEAARAVMAYGFDTLGLDAQTAGHHPENTNSQALITRLGFQYTHSEFWGPANVMTPYYRLRREAWQRS